MINNLICLEKIKNLKSTIIIKQSEKSQPPKERKREKREVKLYIDQIKPPKIFKIDKNEVKEDYVTEVYFINNQKYHFFD